MSSSISAIEPGSGNHIMSKGFQPPPKRPSISTSKIPKTRKRLSMNFNSFPLATASTPSSPAQGSASKSVYEPQLKRSSSVSVALPQSQPSIPAVSSSTHSPSTSSHLISPASSGLGSQELLSHINDALTNKSHRLLRTRSTSLTLSPQSIGSDTNNTHNKSNSQGLPSSPNNNSSNNPITPVTTLRGVDPLSSSSSQVTLTSSPLQYASPVPSSHIMSPSSSSVSATSVSSAKSTESKSSLLNSKHTHKQSRSGSSIPASSGGGGVGNGSSNGAAAGGSTAASSAVEYYFSQLAYRERRIVELRDEIKRMQQQLKQAENDLTLFKKQVPTKDFVRPDQSTTTSVSSTTSPKFNLKRSGSQHKRLVFSHTGGNGNGGVVGNNSLSQHNQSQTASNRRSSYLVHSHVSESSTSTISSRHSNSLSASSASSLTSSIQEEDDERCNKSISTNGFQSGSGNINYNHIYSNGSAYPSTGSTFLSPTLLPDSSNTPISTTNNAHSRITNSCSSSNIHSSNSLSYQDDVYYNTGGVHTGLYDKHEPKAANTTDNVIHMGKRVVEELGTQFWSFLEDIKNVAVGDDARDTTSGGDNGNNGSYNNSGNVSGLQSHHGKSKSLAVNQSSSYSRSKSRYLPTPLSPTILSSSNSPSSSSSSSQSQDSPEIELKAVGTRRQSTTSSFPVSSFGRGTPAALPTTSNFRTSSENNGTSNGAGNGPVDSTQTVELNKSPSASPLLESRTTFQAHPITSFSTSSSTKATNNTDKPAKHFDPNTPSASISSLNIKGMASGMGAAVTSTHPKDDTDIIKNNSDTYSSDNDTSNSFAKCKNGGGVSLGRSATVSGAGGNVTRRVAKKVTENSYYIV